MCVAPNYFSHGSRKNDCVPSLQVKYGSQGINAFLIIVGLFENTAA